MSNIIPTGKDISNSAIANTLQIKTIDDLQKLGEILSKSGFFEDFRQAAQAVVKILAGSELGLSAFSSMVGIHIIKGKPALGANLIAAAVKRSTRYNYRVLELNDKVCKIAFLELGTEIGISEFTAADAARAGTQNMTKFAKNMLFARAISNGVKWFCPDIFLGTTVYTPDELGATVDEDGEVIELPIPNQQSDHADEPTPSEQVWKQWNNPQDAINWAEKQLPSMSKNEIQALFDALPTKDGKKAPAWVERVHELMLEQF